MGRFRNPFVTPEGRSGLALALLAALSLTLAAARSPLALALALFIFWAVAIVIGGLFHRHQHREDSRTSPARTREPLP